MNTFHHERKNSKKNVLNENLKIFIKDICKPIVLWNYGDHNKLPAIDTLEQSIEINTIVRSYIRNAGNLFFVRWC